MNYQQAKEIRSKSYISGITEKLIAGNGLASAVSKTLSEKSKARNVGFKEKFDPLNLIKFMTGGSKLAPALLGRMMGRSQQDIKYFSGAGKTKDAGTTTKIEKLETDNQILETLYKIYEYMKKTHDEEVDQREKISNFREEQQLEKEKRHKELIAAITGRKATKVTATPIKDPEKETGLFGAIFNTVAAMIASALKSVNSLIDGLSSMVKGILEGFAFMKGVSALESIAKIGRFFFATPLGALILASTTLAELLYRDEKPEETTKGIINAGDISAATQTQLEANKSFEDLSPEDKKKEKARIVKLNAALKDAPTLTRFYQKDVPQYLKSKGYSASEIDELITPVQDRIKFEGPENDPTKMNLTPKTPADIKQVPTQSKAETLPSIPPSQQLSEKTKESVTLSLPAATPKSVSEAQTINNTSVVNTNKPMVQKNPLPSVRNTEKSFSEMIFYSTRVV
jgi:hypothetical protein